MSGPYGDSGSRVWVVMAFLLGMALLATLIAVALAMGVLRLADDGPIVGASPSPSAIAAGTDALESPVASPTDVPATATPAATAAASALAGATPGGTHVVQSGESLFSISVLYGVSMQAIIDANEIENPDYIVPGQVLVIPSPADQSPGGTGVHYVQPGESISSIALDYGITPTELADANNIEDWDLIYVGQALTIPGAGGSPTPEP